jgi:hypothetical protein
MTQEAISGFFGVVTISPSESAVLIFKQSSRKALKDTMAKVQPQQIEEPLPIGVGRLPEWWMEITPHNTLDLEQEEARRALEDQMAFYYAQMAAADDAGTLGPDGKPMLDSNGNPLTSSSSGNNGWQGRAAGGGGGAGEVTGPGGRKFAPGTAVINPALFGIDKSDPDYNNYLTGAKLPPGYFDRMAEFSVNYNKERHGQEGMANNLAQTDYGRYGRQAETSNFKPSWAKLKLRSTNHGSAIRNGVTASPEKTSRRVHESSSTGALAAPIPPIPYTEPPQLEEEAKSLPKEVKKEGKKEGKPTRMTRMVRKVRKIRPVRAVRKDAPKAEIQKQQEQAPPRPAPQVIPPMQQMYYPESEDEYDEEVIDDDEYEEEIIEEEIIEDEYEEPPKAPVNMNDLKAILAAKQAELLRLQALA